MLATHSIARVCTEERRKARAHPRQTIGLERASAMTTMELPRQPQLRSPTTAADDIHHGDTGVRVQGQAVSGRDRR
jgi:hypothetical protein